jgi:type I restriction enzyme S subunit
MSFPRYPKYKDSGVEWTSEIPDHWQTIKGHSILSEKYETNKGMVSDNLLSLSFGRIVRRDVNTNDGLLPESFETYQVVEPGEIVFRPTDLQNDWNSLRSAIVTDRGIITSAYIAVKPRDGSSWFLNYLFRAYDLAKVFYSMGGGLRQAFKFKDIVNLPLIFPPLAEQHAIASFLDRETAKIDALIAEQQRLIELLQEKRQAVISHAVTKGLNPDAPMKDSGIEWLGEVPAHWEVRPLKYLATFQSGGTPSKEKLEYWNGDVPWASSKDMKSEVISDTIDHISQKAVDDGIASMVTAGSVLVVVRGMILLHTFPVVQVDRPMAINQDLKALSAGNGVLQSYLPWLLRGTPDATFQQVDEAAHGTKVLRMETWASIMLPVPPRNEQAEITSCIIDNCRCLDELMVQAEVATSLLQERRSALISAAVTGQIDVRGSGPKEAA